MVVLKVSVGQGCNFFNLMLGEYLLICCVVVLVKGLNYFFCDGKGDCKFYFLIIVILKVRLDNMIW